MRCYFVKDKKKRERTEFSPACIRMILSGYGTSLAVQLSKPSISNVSVAVNAKYQVS